MMILFKKCSTVLFFCFFIFLVVANSQDAGKGLSTSCPPGQFVVNNICQIKCPTDSITDYAPAGGSCVCKTGFQSSGGSCEAYQLCSDGTRLPTTKTCPKTTPPTSNSNIDKRTRVTPGTECVPAVIYSTNVVSKTSQSIIAHKMSICGQDQDAGDALKFYGSFTFFGSFKSSLGSSPDLSTFNSFGSFPPAESKSTALTGFLSVKNRKVETTITHDWTPALNKNFPKTAATTYFYNYGVNSVDKSGTRSNYVTYRLNVTPLTPILDTGLTEYYEDDKIIKNTRDISCVNALKFTMDGVAIGTKVAENSFSYKFTGDNKAKHKFVCSNDFFSTDKTLYLTPTIVANNQTAIRDNYATINWQSNATDCEVLDYQNNSFSPPVFGVPKSPITGDVRDMIDWSAQVDIGSAGAGILGYNLACKDTSYAEKRKFDIKNFTLTLTDKPCTETNTCSNSKQLCADKTPSHPMDSNDGKCYKYCSDTKSTVAFPENCPAISPDCNPAIEKCEPLTGNSNSSTGDSNSSTGDSNSISTSDSSTGDSNSSTGDSNSSDSDSSDDIQSGGFDAQTSCSYIASSGSIQCINLPFCSDGSYAIQINQNTDGQNILANSTDNGRNTSYQYLDNPNVYQYNFVCPSVLGGTVDINDSATYDSIKILQATVPPYTHLKLFTLSSPYIQPGARIKLNWLIQNPNNSCSITANQISNNTPLTDLLGLVDGKEVPLSSQTTTNNALHLSIQGTGATSNTLDGGFISNGNFAPIINNSTRFTAKCTESKFPGTALSGTHTITKDVYVIGEGER